MHITETGKNNIFRRIQETEEITLKKGNNTLMETRVRGMGNNFCFHPISHNDSPSVKKSCRHAAENRRRIQERRIAVRYIMGNLGCQAKSGVFAAAWCKNVNYTKRIPAFF